MEPHVIVLLLAEALLALDCAQSVQIALHPEKWEEKNRILGTHPHPLYVCAYFTVCAWLTMVGALWPPHPWGLIVPSLVAVLELVVVIRNRYLVKIPFWS